MGNSLCTARLARFDLKKKNEVNPVLNLFLWFKEIGSAVKKIRDFGFKRILV
jgi:hypothetical protein